MFYKTLYNIVSTACILMKLGVFFLVLHAVCCHLSYVDSATYIISIKSVVKLFSQMCIILFSLTLCQKISRLISAPVEYFRVLTKFSSSNFKKYYANFLKIVFFTRKCFRVLQRPSSSQILSTWLNEYFMVSRMS